MKILFFCTAFNSLSQRVALVLKSRGHAVTVELALAPELMVNAAELASPDIIICPFLTKRVPPAVYSRWLTLIVHPGPPGDAGPSALDWTLFGDLGENENAVTELALIDAAHASTIVRKHTRSHWGVTVLQAIEAFDAGPVWAFDQFKLDQHTRNMSKSDLYRGPVTRAAVNAVLAALEIARIVATQTHGKEVMSPDLKAPAFARSHCVSKGLPFQGGLTHDRPLLKASSRDFFNLGRGSQYRISAETVVQRIQSGDSQPGVLTSLFGAPLFVYNATIQKEPLPATIGERAQIGGPGTLLATRDGAVLVDAGADYPVWISHLRRPKAKSDRYLHPKLPATMTLLSMPELASQLGLLHQVEEWSASKGEGIDDALPWQKRAGTYQQVWVELETIGVGDKSGFQIGYIHFEFYNGAASTTQCEILLQAISWTLAQPDLRAIVMLGGSGYFSNGIALNVIEGSTDPSAEGWANINAIDDCVQALLAPAGVVTFAAIRGNAAAGGLALATAADVVLCAESAVLNPHYRGIGLFGSEYHTYSWSERCGVDGAAEFAHDMLPMSSKNACKLGLIDHVIENERMNADDLLAEIKSIVRNMMTAKVADIKQHIGAPWTRPLRPTFGRDQLPLSQFMLENKFRFMAYTFSGNGYSDLTFEEHFEQYRTKELDQMKLDFFHPHRNKRFASRCTAFVRKLIPASTPTRFALHRRHNSSQWDTLKESTILRDEEELDKFDGLGQFPTSAAIPRLPLSRPEYVFKPVTKTESHYGLDMARRLSTESTTSSLCSGLSAGQSNATFSLPCTPSFERYNPLECNIGTTPREEAHGQHLMATGQSHPEPSTVAFLDAKHGCSQLEHAPTNDAALHDKAPQLPPAILWSCYYSENGKEDAPNATGNIVAHT